MLPKWSYYWSKSTSFNFDKATFKANWIWELRMCRCEFIVNQKIYWKELRRGSFSFHDNENILMKIKMEDVNKDCFWFDDLCRIRENSMYISSEVQNVLFININLSLSILNHALISARIFLASRSNFLSIDTGIHKTEILCWQYLINC